MAGLSQYYVISIVFEVIDNLSTDCSKLALSTISSYWQQATISWHVKQLGLPFCFCLPSSYLWISKNFVLDHIDLNLCHIYFTAMIHLKGFVLRKINITYWRSWKCYKLIGIPVVQFRAPLLSYTIFL